MTITILALLYQDYESFIKISKLASLLLAKMDDVNTAKDSTLALYTANKSWCRMMH